jgi:hypothetical protein
MVARACEGCIGTSCSLQLTWLLGRVGSAPPLGADCSNPWHQHRSLSGQAPLHQLLAESTTSHP